MLNKEAIAKLTIGIVVPFEEMIAQYEELFNERLLHKFDTKKIKIGLPSAFRGQERDIIIVSSFRNSADKGLGAFKSRTEESQQLDESELLMAFTRARKFLWCVGSLDTLEATGTLPLRQLAAFVRKNAQNSFQYKRFETQNDWKKLQLSKAVFSNPMKAQARSEAAFKQRSSSSHLEERKTAPSKR